jgi:hypothetical protein
MSEHCGEEKSPCSRWQLSPYVAVLGLFTLDSFYVFFIQPVMRLYDANGQKENCLRLQGYSGWWNTRFESYASVF